MKGTLILVTGALRRWHRHGYGRTGSSRANCTHHQQHFGCQASSNTAVQQSVWERDGRVITDVLQKAFGGKNTWDIVDIRRLQKVLRSAQSQIQGLSDHGRREWTPIVASDQRRASQYSASWSRACHKLLKGSSRRPSPYCDHPPALR